MPIPVEPASGVAGSDILVSAAWAEEEIAVVYSALGPCMVVSDYYIHGGASLHYHTIQMASWDALVVVVAHIVDMADSARIRRVEMLWA